MHNDTRLRLEAASEQACTEVTNVVRKYLQIQRALGRDQHDVEQELHEGDIEQCSEVWDEDPPEYSAMTGNDEDDVLNVMEDT